MNDRSVRGKERNGSPHLLLIFPPVWIPMGPYLAIPSLTAYLRQNGVRVTPLDANVDFFTDYLLCPQTLEPFLTKAQRIMQGVEASSELPPSWRELLQREILTWEAAVSSTEATLSVLRQKDRFLNPDLVLRAQDRLLGLLHLCSIVHWPGRISFSPHRRHDVRTAQDLLKLCEDSERNVFLPFFRQRILPKIRAALPTAVGISISTGQQILASMTLARLIRLELPGVHVVVGGQRLLMMKEHVLHDPFVYRNFFHSAVLHEGETPLNLLLKALHAGSDLHEVPNLMFLENGKVKAGKRTDPIPLEDLPQPDFDGTPWEKYLIPVRYAPVRLAEGCYWGKCTFCGRVGPEGAVFTPPQRALDKFQYLVDVYGVRDLSVNDDCLPPSYWEEITEGILRKGLQISMVVWAKPVAGFSAELLRKMAAAGVKQIRWGVESAHPRVLKLMRKGTEVKSTLRVLGDAHDAGIWNHACFIVGFPTESREEARTTLDFIRSNKGIIQSFILNPFELLKDSYIYRQPEEFGIRDLRLEATPLWNQITYTVDRGMNQEEIHELVMGAKQGLLAESYHWPFWYYLKWREYLHIYLNRYGLDEVLNISFKRDGLRRFFSAGSP